MTEYAAVAPSIVGNERVGWETLYFWDGERFGSRAAAKRHGFTLGRSDDFLIVTLDGERVVNVGWMDEDRSDSQEIAEVNYAFGFEETA